MARSLRYCVAFVFLMAVLLGAAVSGTARPAQAYLPTPTPPPCIPIDQAIAQGLVRVSLTGSGDLFYKTPIHYRVENLTDQPLVICFPVGMLLDPGDGSMQTMMVAVTAVIELGAGEVREGDLAAFCINETKHAPSEGAAYQVGGTAEGSLLNLAYAIDAQSADGHIGAQLAVWAITDGFNLNELSVTPEPGNPTLVETIAPLLCLAQEEITLSQQLLEQAEAGVSLFQGENPLTAACEEQGIPSLDSILDRLKVIGIGAAVALALGGLVCIGLVVLLIVLVVRMLRKRK